MLALWDVSNGILLGLILPMFGVIFTDRTPSHNMLAEKIFGLRLVENYEGGHPQDFFTLCHIDSAFLE